MLDTDSDVAVLFQSCRLVFRLTLGLEILGQSKLEPMFFASGLQKALKGMPLNQLK